MMKKILIIPCLLLAASCSDNGNKADAWGSFEAAEITVSAEVPGKILQLDLSEGQVLEQGALVGLTDTVDWHLKKAQLQAQKNAIAAKYPGLASQIAVQEQQLKNMETDRMRVDKLYQAGAATKKQLDDMDGNIDLIKKQILSIESQNAAVAGELGSISRQIDQAEVQLGRCHITNPVRGTVLRKYAEPGELAQAGKPLYKIADLTHLYLRVYVSGSLLPSVKIGDTADVFYDLDETSDQKTEGVISWVSSSAEFTPKIIQTKEERVNLVYAVKIRVPNDGRLKIGMPGEARFRNN